MANFINYRDLTMKCHECESVLSNLKHLKRHVMKYHKQLNSKCCYCGKIFGRFNNLILHVNSCVRIIERSLQANKRIDNIPSCKSVLGGAIRKFERKIPSIKHIHSDLIQNLKQLIFDYKIELKNTLITVPSVKVYINAVLNFVQENHLDVFTDPPPNLNSMVYVCTRYSNLDSKLTMMYSDICRNLNSLETTGSGWTLHQIMEVNAIIAQYDPLKGGAIKNENIPSILWNSKSLSHPPHQYNCFIYAIIKQLFFRETKVTEHYEQYIDQLNLTHYSEPMRLDMIPKFGKSNRCSISVYGFEKKTIFPIQVPIEFQNLVFIFYLLRQQIP